MLFLDSLVPPFMRYVSISNLVFLPMRAKWPGNIHQADIPFRRYSARRIGDYGPGPSANSPRDAPCAGGTLDAMMLPICARCQVVMSPGCAGEGWVLADPPDCEFRPYGPRSYPASPPAPEGQGNAHAQVKSMDGFGSHCLAGRVLNRLPGDLGQFFVPQTE